MTPTRVYSVPGVSCEHCRTAIEGEVGRLDEVEAVSVDLAAKEVSVTGTAEDATVRAAIDAAGYDVA
jgi:copper chaperone CopZ